MAISSWPAVDGEFQLKINTLSKGLDNLPFFFMFFVAS
jgi:hypothetical protein